MGNHYQDYVASKVVEVATFTDFPPEFHEEIEQLRRRINAKKIKSEEIIKTDSCYLVPSSSGSVYQTTFESCTCFDFASREMPCKHMYRIALDNGLIEDLPAVSKKASKEFAEYTDQYISHFRNIYNQGAISAEKFLKIIDTITKGK